MKLAKATQLFKGLGDRTRLRILNLLAARELTGTELADILKAPRARVARHLRYLYRSQLVVPRHAANEAYYSLREDADATCRALTKAMMPHLRHIEGMSNDIRRLRALRTRSRKSRS